MAAQPDPRPGLSAPPDPAPPDDWDPMDPAALADPPAVHARLRAEAPVAWCNRWGGFYTLMRHADVVEASRDPARFTATRQTVIPTSPRAGLPRLPLQRDPPEADRYRAGLNLFFKENRIRALEPQLAAFARARWDEMAATPARADFARRYAGPFSLDTLCLLVGLDPAEGARLGELSHAYVAAVQGEDLATAGGLSAAIDRFAIDLVADRRAAPRDPETDMVSGLMAHAPEGGPYDDTELAGMIRLLLIGGHVVPRNFLCSAAFHLAQDPALRARLAAEPALTRPLIEELLRFYAPNQALVRRTTCPVTIGGRDLPADVPVALNFLSANRDEAVFDRPMEFVPDRQPNRHIAFGIGPHVCIGQSVARMQARLTLALLAAAPGLAVAEPPVRARWTEYGIAGLVLDLRAAP